MSKILTIDEALKDGNVDLIEEALDQFNDRRIVDERIFTELKRGVQSPESIKNFLRLDLQKGFSRIFQKPAKIYVQ